ncbi:MAG: hypothetical protein AB4426_24870 [Xenococcaceae cyanobacterium]
MKNLLSTLLLPIALGIFTQSAIAIEPTEKVLYLSKQFPKEIAGSCWSSSNQTSNASGDSTSVYTYKFNRNGQYLQRVEVSFYYRESNATRKDVNYYQGTWKISDKIITISTSNGEEKFRLLTENIFEASEGLIYNKNTNCSF